MLELRVDEVMAMPTEKLSLDLILVVMPRKTTNFLTLGSQGHYKPDGRHFILGGDDYYGIYSSSGDFRQCAPMCCFSFKQ